MDANTKDVLIIALPLFGSLVTGAISAYVAIKMAELKVQVQTVASAVNGRMDQMLDSAKKVGQSEGRKEGRQAQRGEEADFRAEVRGDLATAAVVAAEVVKAAIPKVDPASVAQQLRDFTSIPRDK